MRRIYSHAQVMCKMSVCTMYVKPSNKRFIILNPPFCLAFQVDIPTLITENVAKEGLKHLEMYLSIKEKGICQCVTV